MRVHRLVSFPLAKALEQVQPDPLWDASLAGRGLLDHSVKLVYSQPEIAVHDGLGESFPLRLG